MLILLHHSGIYFVLSEGFEPSLSRFVAEDFIQLNYESMCAVYWNRANLRSDMSQPPSQKTRPVSCSPNRIHTYNNWLKVRRDIISPWKNLADLENYDISTSNLTNFCSASELQILMCWPQGVRTLMYRLTFQLIMSQRV